jgi:hypothetical protein
MERLLFLKSHKQRPYLMRDIKIRNQKQFITLARWVNQQQFFQAKTFEQYCEIA